MLNRRAIVSEVLFLFLIAVTSIYYFYVGQWKSYVRLFSIVEILVLSVTLVLFVLGKVKKPHYKGTLIIFAFGILCVMQLFPMIGALVLGYRYLCIFR